MGFLGFGAIAGLLWYTGHQVIDGELGIGTLTGFLLYGVAIGASLGTIAGLYGQFREGTGAIERVFEIIDTRPTILDAPDARPIGTVAGEIAFEDVSFGYRPDRPVLRDIDARDRGRGDPRPGRPVGLGQDDPRRAHPAPVGRDRRARSGSTASTSAT